MPAVKTSSPARPSPSRARSEIVSQLKDDHKRVKLACRAFQKLNVEHDPEQCQAIVTQVLAELSVHAALEEELLYPAVRSVMKEGGLIDEAEVEHESAHAMIAQLSTMGPHDDKYAARFIVLCEYVMHHVKEEEGELFPKLRSLQIDWIEMQQQFVARRDELVQCLLPDMADADAGRPVSGSAADHLAGLTRPSRADRDDAAGHVYD